MSFPSIKILLATVGFGVTCLGLTHAAGAQSATPGQSASPADAVAVVQGDYRLAPDDQIDIAVEGRPEFDKSVVVLPNGTFSYLERTVKAAGLTTDDLTQILTRALRGQLRRRPQVTVSVRQAHIRQVSVLGAARAPGKYPYLAGMHVLDVLADSAGPAQANELTDATLVTNNGASSQSVDLVKLMQGTDPSLNVPVQPGDVLLLQARNPATAMVLIRGQVAHEGQYAVRPEGATIMAMLTQAGGMSASAAVTRVQLMHGGRTTTLNMRPTLFDTTAAVGQTPIVAGDTIAVPLNNTKYMVLGEVNSRNVYGLPDGEPITVTRAMAQAGGPTTEADLKNVEIVRGVEGSKVSYISVNMDDILNKKSTHDPVLQDGDILYFPKRSHGNTAGSVSGGIGALFSLSALGRLLRGGF